MATGAAGPYAVPPSTLFVPLGMNAISFPLLDPTSPPCLFKGGLRTDAIGD
jgi:hypothetical protein